MIKLMYLYCLLPFLILVPFESVYRRARAGELSARRGPSCVAVDQAKAKLDRASDHRFYARIWCTIASAVIWVVVEWHILSTLAEQTSKP